MGVCIISMETNPTMNGVQRMARMQWSNDDDDDESMLESSEDGESSGKHGDSAAAAAARRLEALMNDSLDMSYPPMALAPMALAPIAPTTSNEVPHNQFHLFKGGPIIGNVAQLIQADQESQATSQAHILAMQQAHLPELYEWSASKEQEVMLQCTRHVWPTPSDITAQAKQSVSLPPGSQQIKWASRCIHVAYAPSKTKARKLKRLAKAAVVLGDVVPVADDSLCEPEKVYSTNPAEGPAKSSKRRHRGKQQRALLARHKASNALAEAEAAFKAKPSFRHWPDRVSSFESNRFGSR
jgi:hypothetical protein